jgi:hypothetical protein
MECGLELELKQHAKNAALALLQQENNTTVPPSGFCIRLRQQWYRVSSTKFRL